MAENCSPQGNLIVNANDVQILVPFTCDGSGEIDYYPLEAQTDGSFSFTMGTADAQNKNTKFDEFVPTRKSATVDIGYQLIDDDHARAQQAFEDYTFSGKFLPVQINRPGKRSIFGKGLVTTYGNDSATDAGPSTATASLRLKGAFGYDPAYALG